MASIFGDESADEKAQLVFAVAGLLGFDWQWDMTVSDWLAITKGEEFHATDWERKYADDPDKSKHKAQHDSYRELVRVVRLSGLHGCGVAVDLAGYREAFPHITQEMAYHKCFIEVSNELVQEADKHGYSELKFTFDHRQGEKNTGVLYDWMTSQPEWKKTNIFFGNEISFGSRKNPRLQMADLLARETMKGLERNLKGLKYRRSLIALARSHEHFQFKYLHGDYFRDMKSKFSELERLTGMYREDFVNWVKQRNMQDNVDTRLRYLIWLDAKRLRRD